MGAASEVTWGVVFALVTALMNAVAVTTQHIASTSGPSSAKGREFLSRLVRHPLWLLGWIALGGSLVFQALALHVAPLTLVQPLLVLELGFGLALRRVWLRQRVARRAWFIAALTTVALAVFLTSVESASANSASPPMWAGPSIAALVLVGGLLLLGWRGSPSRRAGAWGGATAVLWALEAVYIKATTDVLASHGVGATLTHWPFYAFVLIGVGGLVCEQAALHAGPLRASQTAIVVIDPLVSVALGMSVYSEHVAHGVLATLVAVVALGAALVGARALVAATPEETTLSRRSSEP